MNKPIYYSVNGEDHRYPFKSEWNLLNAEYWGYIAEDAGEDFWDNHDGWEACWPIEFAFFENKVSDAIFSAEVNSEGQPSFYSRIKEKKHDAKILS
jgi:hypothetical protein